MAGNFHAVNPHPTAPCLVLLWHRAGRMAGKVSTGPEE